MRMLQYHLCFRSEDADVMRVILALGLYHVLYTIYIFFIKYTFNILCGFDVVKRKLDTVFVVQIFLLIVYIVWLIQRQSFPQQRQDKYVILPSSYLTEKSVLLFFFSFCPPDF